MYNVYCISIRGQIYYKEISPFIYPNKDLMKKQFEFKKISIINIIFYKNISKAVKEVHTFFLSYINLI